MGHDAKKQSAVRDEIQATLLELSRELGAASVGPELMEAISSGAAVHDASGRFVGLARHRFGLAGNV